jgi:hypothetical protein
MIGTVRDGARTSEAAVRFVAEPDVDDGEVRSCARNAGARALAIGEGGRLVALPAQRVRVRSRGWRRRPRLMAMRRLRVMRTPENLAATIHQHFGAATLECNAMVLPHSCSGLPDRSAKRIALSGVALRQDP